MNELVIVFHIMPSVSLLKQRYFYNAHKLISILQKRTR